MNRLSYAQRLRMAWELTWPLAMMDAAVVLLLHGWFNAAGETWDSMWLVISFFVVSPWVIRRALRRQYGPYKIAVVHRDRRDTLNYQESLKVMWLLAWRTLVLSLVALVLVSLLMRLTGVAARDFSTQDPMVNNLGLSAVDAVSSLVFSPLLIPGMLRKRYRGFSLEVQGRT